MVGDVCLLIVRFLWHRQYLRGFIGVCAQGEYPCLYYVQQKEKKSRDANETLQENLLGLDADYKALEVTLE